MPLALASMDLGPISRRLGAAETKGAFARPSCDRVVDSFMHQKP
jgi:hypothetical protein